MIALYGKAEVITTEGSADISEIFRVVTKPFIKSKCSFNEILYLKEPAENLTDLTNWTDVLVPSSSDLSEGHRHIGQLPDELGYLGDGDIIRYSKNTGSIRVLYRPRTSFNALLLTERCNHFCLMCSQPPRDIDDGFIVKELLAAIPMMARDSGELCLSGGEPTLTGDGFYDIIDSAKKHLPEKSLHILTNGRHFSDNSNAVRLSKINHPDLMLGIPLYSDHPVTHNFVVQSNKAFDETLRGIINLKAQGIRVEVRFVLHKYTVARIREFAEFICRNLLFVDHVAFMGLETIGFAKSNIKELWVEPSSYMKNLSYACDLIAQFGGNPSIYNSQLCLLQPESIKYYRRSISDWKNEFLDQCENCYGKSHCCGFFASNQKYHSKKLKPFEDNESLENFMNKSV